MTKSRGGSKKFNSHHCNHPTMIDKEQDMNGTEEVRISFIVFMFVISVMFIMFIHFIEKFSLVPLSAANCHAL